MNATPSRCDVLASQMIYRSPSEYFNGEKMHHDYIAKAIADILDKSIMKTGHELKITF